MTQSEKTALEVKALQDLQLDPLKFLRKNSVTPANAAGTTAGLSDYYMVLDSFEAVGDPTTLHAISIKRPGAFLGNMHKQQGYKYKIKSHGGGTRFQAIYIPVQPSNVAINPFPLGTTGASFMITTQLTGCCIVMVPQGASWGVAHLQPINEDGIELRKRLSALGIRVYGATDYSGGRATLIGVRQAGNWDFYTQILDSNFNVISYKKLSS